MPWVCPTYVPPSGHSETSSHFILKIFDMLTRIRFTVLSSRVSFWIPKCLYWVISPSSSYPQSHRQFLVPSGLPVLVLWPELGAWVTLLCCPLSHAPSLGLVLASVEGGRERDNNQPPMRFVPSSWNCSSPKEEGSPPLEFWIFWILVGCYRYCNHQIA